MANNMISTTETVLPPKAHSYLGKSAKQTSAAIGNFPRRYDIDALRSLAFLLLILYHVAMFYVADWGWHIKSIYQSELIKFPMILVNQWRMPLLFLVSGLACSFLLRKLSPSEFLKSRTLRLLVPFIVGCILVIPPQAYLQAKANGSLAANFDDMNYLQFLWHYFTFQGWPANAFDGAEYGFTWNHLWFIPYIATYTILLVPIRKLLPAAKLEASFNKIGMASLILVPVLIQIAWKIITDDKDINHTFFADTYAHGIYFTFFVIGYLLADQEHLWSIIVKLRWFALGVGIVTYIFLLSLWWVFHQIPARDVFIGVTASFNQWFWLLAGLGWAATLLNHPYQWIKYINDRVYPWYIFHQTIIIIAAYYLSMQALGGIVESFLVTLITVLGCWLSTVIIAKSKTLKVLFGMK